MLAARKFRNRYVKISSYFDKNLKVDTHVYVFNHFYSSNKHYCMLNCVLGAFAGSGEKARIRKQKFSPSWGLYSGK